MLKYALAVVLLFSVTGAFADNHGHWQLQIGNQLPAHVLQIGHQTDGSPLYLCQAGVIFGGVQPGKTWNNYGICNVPYAGKEKLQHLFNVYVLNTNADNRHHWRFVDHQIAIPSSALQAGHEQNGRTLYLCRAKLDKGMQPGKTWAGYYGCNVPYGGQEKVMRPYEIFIWGGHHRHHHW